MIWFRYPIAAAIERYPIAAAIAILIIERYPDNDSVSKRYDLRVENLIIIIIIVIIVVIMSWRIITIVGIIICHRVVYQSFKQPTFQMFTWNKQTTACFKHTRHLKFVYVWNVGCWNDSKASTQSVITTTIISCRSWSSLRPPDGGGRDPPRALLRRATTRGGSAHHAPPRELSAEPFAYFMLLGLNGSRCLIGVGGT